ncbi:ABC transporter permease [Bradyrhizobium sp. LTSP885]|uniref:ABC transporter substrate-binding protein n=1 Tax=Bradyrhizobium sp. LTSP885 TaxID=1619232 RepID=UPI0005CB34E4|nr:ABC transporter substrate-binding protein [Bradyrhizobium sp. LTSP885]KJC50460.1 ABC transporter permease [Bradyrhizobium sp. LTSP885]
MKKRLLLAALLAAAIIPPAAAQYSDNAIKIGVLSDLSGPLADNTGQGGVTAAQMAIDDAGGSIDGVPITLISADHQNKADIGAAIARKWYESEGVDLIVDVPNSAVALAVQGITREKNRVVIFSGPAISDLTGKACSPNGFHWTYDTYSLAHVGGEAAVSSGAKSFFFITSDFAFGHALERDMTNVVTAKGAKVVGGVKSPLNNPDFASFILQAQSSKADVIVLATSGDDTTNAIKQAGEFGVGQSKQKLMSLLIAINEVHALGTKTAQGMLLTSAFYWDMNDETRVFAKRFFEKRKAMPSMYQAGVYSAVAHYLKSVKAAKTDRAEKLTAKMRELPVSDFMTKNGVVRADGRVVRDMYLFQVKTPEESKQPWDYYKLLETIPGEKAFRPLSEGGCDYVAKQ